MPISKRLVAWSIELSCTYQSKIIRSAPVSFAVSGKHGDCHRPPQEDYESLKAMEDVFRAGDVDMGQLHSSQRYLQLCSWLQRLFCALSVFP